MAQEIQDSEFEVEVNKANRAVLIDFWAEWCGPCKMLAPILTQLSEEMADKVKVVKMNIDTNPNTPSSLGVRSIPTLMLFYNGKMVSSKVGVHTKSQIKDWIHSSLVL